MSHLHLLGAQVGRRQALANDQRSMPRTWMVIAVETMSRIVLTSSGVTQAARRS